MNKLLTLILIFVMVKNILPQNNNYNKSLLWEITGKELKEPSYLFGTIHTSIEKFFDLSDSVFIAIESSEYFAGEINMDSLQHFIIKLSSQESTNTDITEILSEEEYKLLDKKLKEKLGVSIDDFGSKDPAVISVALQREEFKGDMPFVMDEYLYKIAKSRGKKISGVETFRRADESFRFTYCRRIKRNAN